MQSKLTILVPCKDEELTISEVISDLQQNLPLAQLIVIDNGSTDLTLSKARAFEKVRSYYEKAVGKSNALRLGLQQLDPQTVYVATIDADLTYTAADLLNMYKIMESQTDIDMIVGNRLYSRKGFKLLNFYFNKFLIYLINLNNHRPVKDLLSGLRIWKIENFAAQDIQSKHFEFETEITIRHLANNKKISYSPISYGPRKEYSLSKISPLKDGFFITKKVLIYQIKKLLLTPTKKS